jgi:tetratricopeptide (TPR) repeat protein
MPKIRPADASAAAHRTALECLQQGLKAERSDDLQRALHHYADAAIQAGDDASIIAQALTRQSAVYRRLSEWEFAVESAKRAFQVADDADLSELRAEALVSHGNALICGGRLDEARGVCTRLARMAIDDRQRAIAQQNLGSIHAQRREFAEAAEAIAQSRVLFEKAGYARGEVISTNNLGRLAHDMGNMAEAERLLSDALSGARAVEDAELEALAQLNLAQVRVALGRFAEAEAMVMGAHGHFVASENRWRQIECLTVLADIAEGEGKLEEATTRLERGREMARQIDARVELAAIEARLEQRR